MTKQTINYTHYDLQLQRAGVTVEIVLSAVANVRLMSSGNFALYKQGQKHQFIGGVARKSPIRLTIPDAGLWHLVVDMQGHHGQATSSIRVIEPVVQPRIQPAT